jgi:hypothetical protein
MKTHTHTSGAWTPGNARAMRAKFVREDEKTGTPPSENGWGRAFITGTLADGTTLVHVLNF